MKKCILYIYSLALLGKSLCNIINDGSNSISPTHDFKQLVASYKPKNADCPFDNRAQIREADSIFKAEETYIDNRRPQTKKALLKFLKNNIIDDNINLENIVQAENITIGLAFSGDGYRSLLTGAGQISALDDRSPNNSSLAGILQASSYISGLSSGSWLISSLLVNGFPNIHQLLDSPDSFNFKEGLITPHGNDIEKNKIYWSELVKQIQSKELAGFNISITDILGRALAYQLFGNQYGKWAPYFSLSAVSHMKAFKKTEMPFPILMAQSFNDHTNIDTSVSTNRTTFMIEMTPYQFGSWDKELNGFIDTYFLGSQVNDINEKSCLWNLDDLGFLMAVSSSNMGPLVHDLVTSSPNSSVEYPSDGFHSSLFDFNISSDETITRLHPNSFFNGDSVSNEDLILTDGGADGQSVPLTPLIQSKRHVDVIFAFDNSGDGEDNYPTGKALYTTFKHENMASSNNNFPDIPDVDEFLKKNLTKRPVFFGCDSITTALIIYIPNSNYIGNANSPTYQATFTDEEVQTLVDNGRAGVTRKDQTYDKEWSNCVACALIKKSFVKKGENSTIPEICEKCFADYCWSRQ